MFSVANRLIICIDNWMDINKHQFGVPSADVQLSVCCVEVTHLSQKGHCVGLDELVKLIPN